MINIKKFVLLLICVNFIPNISFADPFAERIVAKAQENIKSFTPEILKERRVNAEWWKSATPEMVKDMIKSGVDINAKLSFGGNTILMNAVADNENLAIVDIILANGADINARNNNGNTALMIASGNNKNPAVVETLIKHGADVNTRNEMGKTALIFACENDNPDIIKTLIKHGAKIDVQYNDWLNLDGTFNQKSAFKLAAEHNPNPEIIEIFIKEGANVNSKDDKGNTVLGGAVALNKNPAVIETLIKHGADVNAKNVFGLTILMEATLNRNPEVIEILIKHGANNINSKDTHGYTALMMAATNSDINPEVIDALLNHGADVKIKNKEGKTALDYAAENPKIYGTDVYWKLNVLMYK